LVLGVSSLKIEPWSKQLFGSLRVSK
jgi:hypothetical protein